MTDIRVLVVEDSLTIRQRLIEILEGDPGIKVVGQASEGASAVELCGRLRPDVVTLDMVLPGMDGASVAERIMAHSPTPILVVSSANNRGELFDTYDALAAGALEVLEKPTGTEADGAWERKLLDSVRLVSRIKVITHPRGRLRGLGNDGARGQRAEGDARPEVKVVAVGASTGGPLAVPEVLRQLPAPFPVPVLLVLHVGEPFGRDLAEWLDRQSRHRVRLARHGEALASVAGTVLMAPPDRHLVVEDGVVRLTSGPERHSCRPSVDVLFESLARETGRGTTGVLLTGMGRDGAQGLLAIRRAGGTTIAQDEETSVVYGMPAAAAQLGAANRILPLGEIGRVVAALVDRNGGELRP